MMNKRVLPFLIIFLFFPVSSSYASWNHYGQHCEDAEEARKLSALGPILGLGASVSHGLLAKSFPEVVANRMCLKSGEGYYSHYKFFSRDHKDTFKFMKKIYKEHKPKLVIALDYLYHHFKKYKFDEKKRKFLDVMLEHLALDCKNKDVDCSEDGEFAFVEKEYYRPVILLSDVYYDRLVDCSKKKPRPEKYEQCISENIKMNAYLREKVKEYPNIYLMPGKIIFQSINEGSQTLEYNINGIKTTFSKSTLTWDGFHPWTNPGVSVFSNYVIQKLNELIESGVIQSDTKIPFLEIDEEYLTP